MGNKTIWLIWFILSFAFIPALGLNADLVVLTDGSKMVGRVEDKGEQAKIITPNGEFTVAKAEIKAVYQNYSAILERSAEKIQAASIILEEAQKIDDLLKRNRELDKCLDLLNEAKKICFDGLDIFSPAEEKLITNKITEIYMGLKLIRSLKVMEKGVNAGPPQPGLPEIKPPPEVIPELENKQQLAGNSYQIALEHLKNNEYQEAATNLNKALEYNSEFPQVFAKLGETYGLLKDEEKSLHYYQACLNLIEKYVPIGSGHDKNRPDELILLRKEITPKAEKLKKLTEELAIINHETIEDLVGLGAWAIDNRDYLLAADIFNLALEITPQDEDLEFYLREAEELINRSEKEEPGKEHNPPLADLYYELGMKNLKKNVLQARNYFKKAVRYDKNHTPALFKLAVIYENLHALPESINYYYRCVKSLMDKESFSETEKKILSEAQASLQRLDILSRNFLRIKESRVRQLIKLGEDYYNRQYEKFAVRAFQQVLMLEPENKTTFDYLKKLDPSYLAEEIEPAKEETIEVYNLNESYPEWTSEKVQIDQMLGSFKVWRKLDRIQWYEKLLATFSVEVIHFTSDPSGKMLDIILEGKGGQGDKYEFFIRPSIKRFQSVKPNERDCLVYLLKNSRIMKTGSFTAARDTPLKVVKQGGKLFFFSNDKKIIEVKNDNLNRCVFRIGIATSDNIRYNLHTVKIRGEKE
ncbi:MAG: hypothetical protein AAB019_01250 [Planctomycetota bacterium]